MRKGRNVWTPGRGGELGTTWRRTVLGRRPPGCLGLCDGWESDRDARVVLYVITGEARSPSWRPLTGARRGHGTPLGWTMYAAMQANRGLGMKITVGTKHDPIRSREGDKPAEKLEANQNVTWNLLNRPVAGSLLRRPGARKRRGV